MNIFGIGGAELVLIILIMLVVAGPKRMIRWAYVIGQYVAKFRKMWEEVVDVMQKEVDAAGLDVQIPKELPNRQNITKVVSDAVKPYTEQVEKELKEAEQELKSAQKPAQEALDEADKMLQDTQKEASSAIEPKSIANGVTSSTKENLPQESKTKEPLEDDSTSDVSGFGAWSNPQHPSEETEQKAK